MSFQDMKKQDLVEIAEQFGADATGTKAKIIESLEAEGVTYEFYANFLNATSDEQPQGSAKEEVAAPLPEPTGKSVLVKYNGQSSYSGPGVFFSAAAPFALVDEAVANRLISKRPKVFRIASEREVEQFYG